MPRCCFCCLLFHPKDVVVPPTWHHPSASLSSSDVRPLSIERERDSVVWYPNAELETEIPRGGVNQSPKEWGG